MARFRHLLYNLTLIILALPIAIFTAWQAVRRKGGMRFFCQRLLVHRAIDSSGTRPLWAHAASIGEVKAVLPLLEQLLQRGDISQCLLTTNTPEAARLVEGRHHAQIRHRYCPIDWPVFTRYFIARIDPCALVIAETEIWPNLYRAADRRNLPLVIVNGRLSPRTLDQPAPVRKLIADTLHCVDRILARSEADIQGFLQLGVAREKIKLCGNIKLAASRGADTKPLPELLNREYCLAVSTHEPEEILLANALSGLPAKSLLVIVPRHPQRSAAIQRELRAAGFAIAVRSQAQPPLAERSIYLADTVGEVEALICGASLVFVGGSLAPVGGHNLLEPAAWAKPVISGPQLHNFSEEALLLDSFQALQRVQDQSELTACFKELNASAQLRSHWGEAAGRAIDSCHSTLALYVTELACILKEAHKTTIPQRDEPQ